MFSPNDFMRSVHCLHKEVKCTFILINDLPYISHAPHKDIRRNIHTSLNSIAHIPPQESNAHSS